MHTKKWMRIKNPKSGFGTSLFKNTACVEYGTHSRMRIELAWRRYKQKEILNMHTVVMLILLKHGHSAEKKKIIDRSGQAKMRTGTPQLCI